jgi:hypothetical protein
MLANTTVFGGTDFDNTTRIAYRISDSFKSQPLNHMVCNIATLHINAYKATFAFKNLEIKVVHNSINVPSLLN